jgi:hypothetical protein
MSPEHFRKLCFSPGKSAAAAVASLLMPAFTEPGDEPALLEDDEDLAKLGEIVAAAAASPFTGLRMLLARSLGPVWTAPCGPGPEGSDRCRHAIAWSAVEAAARDVSEPAVPSALQEPT